jgi:lysophospholipid acyltransferase (LPLAT)-like uncharacterized protein
MPWHVPPRLAAGLIWVLYRPWCATWRLTEVNRRPVEEMTASGRPVILCLWHDECFALIGTRRDLPLMTVASQSRDGEYIAGALERLGYIVVRGSSSRGGAGALLACARLMRARALTPAITLDGPRGPRHKTKDGVLFLAHSTGAPLVAVRAFARPCVRFGSWDRFALPLPFARMRIVYADPYHIERDTMDAAALAEERAKLERVMRDLEDGAEA